MLVFSYIIFKVFIIRLPGVIGMNSNKRFIYFEEMQLSHWVGPNEDTFANAHNLNSQN